MNPAPSFARAACSEVLSDDRRLIDVADNEPGVCQAIVRAGETPPVAALATSRRPPTSGSIAPMEPEMEAEDAEANSVRPSGTRSAATWFTSRAKAREFRSTAMVAASSAQDISAPAPPNPPSALSAPARLAGDASTAALIAALVSRIS